MSTSIDIQLPARMTSIAPREQTMIVGGALPVPVGPVLLYFALVVCAAVGGAVWGAFTYAVTH